MPAPPPNPGTLPLNGALAGSEPLARLLQRVGESRRRFDAVADLLPPQESPKPKIGFTLPFPVWIRGELKPFLDETFSGASLGHCPWLETKAVQTLWSDFQKSHDTRQWSRIWSLAMLIAFMRRPKP